jgi:hypothetical protein
MANEQENRSTVQILADLQTDTLGFIKRVNDEIFYFIPDGSNVRSGSFDVTHLDSAHLQSTARESNSTLVWVALSVLLGISLFFMVENPLVKLVLVGITALMGFYLVYDHYSQPKGIEVVLCSKASQIKLTIKGQDREIELSNSLRRITLRDKPLKETLATEKRIFAPR